jgi:chemotaxis response regulator CheB
MYAGVHETLLAGDIDQNAVAFHRTFGSAFGIVGIAGSAGGIQPLKELLAVLPGDFECPIVVVQHLCSAAQYKSVLDRILASRTPPLGEMG